MASQQAPSSIWEINTWYPQRARLVKAKKKLVDYKDPAKFFDGFSINLKS